MVIPGPKLADLKRDGRYALHSETFPPPREDDGFYVTGRVVQIDDAQIRKAIADQFFVERPGMEKWSTFDDQIFYELLVDRALLTLTKERDGFPKGPTAWRST
jgi:hypothetical protein